MTTRPRPSHGRPTHAVIATDAFGRIRTWDAGAAAMFGREATEVIGQKVAEIVAAPAATARAVAVQARMNRGEQWYGELALATRLGTDDNGVSCSVTVEPVTDDAGRVVAGVWICADVRAQRRSEHALRRLSNLIDSTGDAVVSVDVHGVVTAWNSQAERLYGVSSVEMIGRPFVEVMPAERHVEWRETLEGLRRGEGRRHLDTVRVHADGSRFEVSVVAIPVLDVDGVFVGATTIARDVTEERQLRRVLAHRTSVDELTGLANRRAADERLRTMLDTAAGRDVGVTALFIDVDRFATVNEAWGHAAGDVLLAELASRLRELCRPNDVVARFGGDEFLVLTQQTGTGAALSMATRIHRAFGETMVLNGHRISCTASIGIAMSPPHDADLLLHHASAAAADAKHQGRARTRVYDAELARRAQTRMDFASELGVALADDKLELRYQPMFDTASGAVIAVEALTRWVHPVHGNVAPAEFVRLAEDTGLIVELDSWVLRRACREMSRLIHAGVVPSTAQVAVNISEHTLVEPRLASIVTEALVRADLSATNLVIEVTETGVMADPDAVAGALQSLAHRGVSISLDDFGTGHASLAHLRRFPLSSIKIDQVFIQAMSTDPDELTIVASVVDLARALGVIAIAEGVETQAQLDLLRRLGCPAAQGFLWSEAVRPAELARLLVGENGEPLRVVETAPQRQSRRAKPVAEVTVDHGLRRLLQLHQEGQSPTTIAAALNADGYRTPQGQRWHPRSVARTLARLVLDAA